MVKLALRKNDTRLSARAIQWWTNSEYSHSELVIRGGCYSSSALDGGVRGKVIPLDSDKWDIIDLPWANADNALTYFAQTSHLKYGWAGIVVNQIFNSSREAGKSPFCSWWIASALGLPNAASYSPVSLKNLCQYLSDKE